MSCTSYARVVIATVLAVTIVSATVAYSMAWASEDDPAPPGGDTPATSAREALQAVDQVEASQDLDGEEDVVVDGDPIERIAIGANDCDVDSGDSITFEVVGGPDEDEVDFATVIDGVNADIGVLENGDTIGVEDIDGSGAIEFFVEGNSDIGTAFLREGDELVVETSTIDCNSTPLKITDRKPADGKTSVRRSTKVSATFSEEIEASTLTQGSVMLINTKTGSAVAAQVSCDEPCTTVTLNPLTKLVKKTRYKAVITTAVQDTEGDSLANNETWTFITKRK